MNQVDIVFTFVRHPLGYYKSVWRYFNIAPEKAINHILRDKWHPNHIPAKLWEPDFNGFVERVIEEEPLYVTRLYEWFIGPENGEFVPLIGRTERLEEDFAEIMKLLQLKYRYRRHKHRVKSIGTYNRARGRGTPEYNDNTKQKVLDVERLAIRRFYEPGNFERIRYASFNHPQSEGYQATRRDVRRLWRVPELRKMFSPMLFTKDIHEQQG